MFSVSDAHVSLFKRADRLLERMPTVPTLRDVAAAYLNEADRVKELEKELNLIRRIPHGHA